MMMHVTGIGATALPAIVGKLVKIRMEELIR